MPLSSAPGWWWPPRPPESASPTPPLLRSVRSATPQTAATSSLEALFTRTGDSLSGLGEAFLADPAPVLSQIVEDPSSLSRLGNLVSMESPYGMLALSVASQGMLAPLTTMMYGTVLGITDPVKLVTITLNGLTLRDAAEARGVDTSEADNEALDHVMSPGLLTPGGLQAGQVGGPLGSLQTARQLLAQALKAPASGTVSTLSARPEEAPAADEVTIGANLKQLVDTPVADLRGLATVRTPADLTGALRSAGERREAALSGLSQSARGVAKDVDNTGKSVRLAASGAKDLNGIGAAVKKAAKDAGDGIKSAADNGRKSLNKAVKKSRGNDDK